MSPAQNPHTPHHAITLHYRITSLHHTIALYHCITSLHYVTASHHCAITHEAPEAPPTPLGDITSLYRSTTEPCDILGRHYCPKTFPNRAVRYPWATLKPRNVPQQFCAAPSGNALPLFRRWRVRIEAVLNKPGDTFSTLGRRFKPTSFPNRAARHSRATYSPKVFPNRAMRHSRATLQPLNVPQQFCATPLGNITASKCSPTEPRDTLGRRYKPISFPNSSARHPRATLCPFFVAGESALIPSRISSETHLQHPWETFQAHIVPQQGRATLSGNTLPLFRRRNVRIDPVMNMLGDTFGTPWARVSRNELLTMEPLAVIAAIKKG